ncbi:MAG TPA: tyrosine-protein phosphatase [Verrucomicrobiae bacterium]|nr:tyrosine-protein phosphatase [Verrucomicrobiae bacterium]
MVVLAIVFPLLTATLCWPGWYDNYHVVIPGELYRSAQMSAPRLRGHIAEDGLRTVINLRPETNELWHTQEQQACKMAGIEFVDFPLAGDRSPSPQQTSALVTILQQARPPILIHCEHGADRTGFAVALYLSEIARLPEPQARAALSIRYGHLAFTRVGCFDDAFAQFRRDRHSPVLP